MPESHTAPALSRLCGIFLVTPPFTQSEAWLIFTEQNFNIREVLEGNLMGQCLAHRFIPHHSLMAFRVKYSIIHDCSLLDKNNGHDMAIVGEPCNVDTHANIHDLFMTMLCPQLCVLNTCTVTVQLSCWLTRASDPSRGHHTHTRHRQSQMLSSGSPTEKNLRKMIKTSF